LDQHDNIPIGVAVDANRELFIAGSPLSFHGDPDRRERTSSMSIR
jgi:hypothetical protein